MVIPHDDLFHFTFQHVHHVVPWLRCVLPARVAAAVDWSRLAPASEKLHSLTQRLSIADLVFRARRSGRRAPVWFVIEHKASDEAGVERQMLRYAVHLGDRARGKRAPVPVVAVLLHHGERPFAVAESTGDPFAPLQPRQPLVVDDIGRAGEVALRARPLSPLGTLALLCLRFLRHMTGDEALAAFDRWGDLLRAVDRDPSPPTGRNAVAKIASYALAVVEVPPAALRETFERLLQRPEETIMSTLENTYQKGLADGQAVGRSTLENTYQKGLADGQAMGRGTLEHTYHKGVADGQAVGRAETILQLLKRFGPLPVGTAERVRAGSEADLARWTDRVLDARTLADVFAD